VALFEASQRQKNPPRVSFKTSSARYADAYWLHVALHREGDFGAADLSVDRATRTMRVHTIDAGLDEVRLDLAAAGIDPGEALAIAVDKPTQAPLVLAGLTRWRAARLRCAGREQALPVQQGVARLPTLAAGNATLIGDPL